MTYKEPPQDHPFKTRLKRLRAEKGLTQKQVADVLGIAAVTVSGWEIGKSLPEAQYLTPLAEVLGTSVDSLLGRSLPADVIRAGHATFVPVFGSVGVREGRLTFLDYKGTHPVPTTVVELAGKSGLISVEAPDDSMASAGIHIGDLVTVPVGRDYDDGDSCVVVVDDEPHQIRRVQRIPGGLVLSAADTNIPAQFFLDADVNRVWVVGPIVGIYSSTPHAKRHLQNENPRMRSGPD